MKQFTFILYCTCLFFSSQAQPGDYNGPAKISVASFWTQADNMRGFIEKGFMNSAQGKLSMLEKNIATTKTKDPSYGTAAMEAELNKLKDMYAAKEKELKEGKETRKEKQENRLKADQLLRSLFGMELVTQVDDAGLKTINQRIEDYRKRTRELLAMDLEESKEDLDNFLSYIKNDQEVAAENFKKLEERVKGATSIGYAEVHYYELLYKQAYWDAAQKVYPGQADFAKTYTAVTNILTGLGSLTDLQATTEKNRLEKVKNTRMPVAKVKDASLEKLFIDAFNKKYQEEFKGTAVKAVITSSEWGIKRNELTGIVIGRQREGAVAYKGADGKCYLVTYFNIFQDYVGGSYQGTKSIYVVYKGQEMLCENIK
jgi:hypothetical protein